MRFPGCIKLYYNPKKLHNSWGAEKSVEERIILHMQSILNAMEENHQNGSHVPYKDQLKEANSLDNKIFIVTFGSMESIGGMFLAKQVIEYTKIVSDPQFQIVIFDHQIPKTFIAVAHTELFAAYQGIYKELDNHIVLNTSEEKMDKQHVSDSLPSKAGSQMEISGSNALSTSPTKPLQVKSSPSKQSSPIVSPFFSFDARLLFHPPTPTTMAFTPPQQISPLQFSNAITPPQFQDLGAQNQENLQLLHLLKYCNSQNQVSPSPIPNPLIKLNLSNPSINLQDSFISQSSSPYSNMFIAQNPSKLFLTINQSLPLPSAITLPLQKPQMEQNSQNPASVLDLIQSISNNMAILNQARRYLQGSS
jgi:hypothetical protein